jgi:hypothetical protein
MLLYHDPQLYMSWVIKIYYFSISPVPTVGALPFSPTVSWVMESFWFQCIICPDCCCCTMIPNCTVPYMSWVMESFWFQCIICPDCCCCIMIPNCTWAESWKVFDFSVSSVPTVVAVSWSPTVQPHWFSQAQLCGLQVGEVNHYNFVCNVKLLKVDRTELLLTTLYNTFLYLLVDSSSMALPGPLREPRFSFRFSKCLLATGWFINHCLKSSPPCVLHMLS